MYYEDKNTQKRGDTICCSTSSASSEPPWLNPTMPSKGPSSSHTTLTLSIDNLLCTAFSASLIESHQENISHFAPKAASDFFATAPIGKSGDDASGALTNVKEPRPGRDRTSGSMFSGAQEEKEGRSLEAKTEEDCRRPWRKRRRERREGGMAGGLRVFEFVCFW